MDNEVSPERARQILDVLTQGGSMAHINTPLALRLMPLAQELGERELVEQLLDHASSVASDVLEEGWTRFEAMKLMETPIGGYLRLAEEDAEGMDGAEMLAAAVHHHIALIYLSEGQLDEARATAQRALRLRQMTEDHQGMVYGMALLMTIAKRQHDEDTAIAIGTERQVVGVAQGPRRTDGSHGPSPTVRPPSESSTQRRICSTIPRASNGTWEPFWPTRCPMGIG